MKKTVLATFVLAGLATGCANYGSNAGVASTAVATTAAGMTLYTFDKDGNNESNCYDGCALKWPPYLVSEGEAPSASASKSTRKDGSEQWSLNNMPLYTWVGDTKPGDTTGDGVGGVWHTAITSDGTAPNTGSSY